MATKYVCEILEEINQDPKLIEKYKGNNALKLVFQYNFDPSKKFILPKGRPPFTEDAAPLGMTPTNLMMELRRLYVFCRADLPDVKRESLFINLLEGLHPSEADVVLAIKDQSLQKKFKKITHKMAFDNGFIDIPPPAPKKRAPRKTKEEKSEAAGV